MAVALASLALVLPPAFAEDAISHPAKKPIGPTSNEMVPSLAVLNAHGATLRRQQAHAGWAWTPNSIVFADRPVRAAGHVLTSHFIKEWDVGNDSFAKDPPNATISVLSKDGATVKDAVVVLKSPKLEGENLTFDVSVLEGDLTGAKRRSRLVYRLVRGARRQAVASWSAVDLPGMAPGTVIPAQRLPPARRSAPQRQPPIMGRPIAVITPTRLATRLS